MCLVLLLIEHFDSPSERNTPERHQSRNFHEDGRSTVPALTGDETKTIEPRDYQSASKDQVDSCKVPEAIYTNADNFTGNAPNVSMPPTGTVNPVEGVPFMGFTTGNPFLPWLMAFGSAQPSFPPAFMVPPVQQPAIYAPQYIPPHAYLSCVNPMALPVTSSIPQQPPFSSQHPILTAIQQQEQEIRRMETQLEAQRIAESQRQEESEFMNLQERLAAVQVRAFIRVLRVE